MSPNASNADFLSVLSNDRFQLIKDELEAFDNVRIDKKEPWQRGTTEKVCNLERLSWVITSYMTKPNKCPGDLDEVCWPSTPVGTYAYQSCPQLLVGNVAVIGSSVRVERFCSINATWETANYSACIIAGAKNMRFFGFHAHVMLAIYWIGYSLSLFFLIAALSIFARYRNLRCLRNKIHSHLFLSHALFNIIWIAWTGIGQFVDVGNFDGTSTTQVLITGVLKYLILAGFMWIGIEGIYLVLIVMRSLKSKNIRHLMCAVTGWGVPVFPVIASASVTAITQKRLRPCLGEICLYDVITLCPIMIILAMNLVVLLVLLSAIHKKASIRSHRRIQSRARRTLRAMFILCPLLGCNYLIVLFIPDRPVMVWLILTYILAIVQSFQGACVAISFCFVNSDVRKTIKLSMDRLRMHVDHRRELSIRQQSSRRLFAASDVLTDQCVESEAFASAVLGKALSIKKKKRPSSGTRVCWSLL